jgi:aromatic ring-opening dioxygenase catalytic subunit (LigB family)
MRQPTIFLPHGGGPCFFMEPPPDEPTRWLAMADYLRRLPDSLPARPKALLVISAHWEMPRPTLLTGANPDLLFDYYNFPPHTYRLTYPAPGAPDLAVKVRSLLADAGIDSDADPERGYDHGIFVPLKVSFPAADIPILQLSLQLSLDPAFHIRVGRALAPLRDENILIIGSGLSFHNLRLLADPVAIAPGQAFDQWLTDVLCEGPVEQREERLVRWEEAPSARMVHPREEHLLPLMVAAGAAAGEPGHHAFAGTLFGKPVSGFSFGAWR